MRFLPQTGVFAFPDVKSVKNPPQYLLRNIPAPLSEQPPFESDNYDIK